MNIMFDSLKYVMQTSSVDMILRRGKRTMGRSAVTGRGRHSVTQYTAITRITKAHLIIIIISSLSPLSPLLPRLGRVDGEQERAEEDGGGEADQRAPVEQQPRHHPR